MWSTPAWILIMGESGIGIVSMFGKSNLSAATDANNRGVPDMVVKPEDAR